MPAIAGFFYSCKTEETLDKNDKTIAKKDYKTKNRTDTNKASDMKMSDKGIEWLKRLEGLWTYLAGIRKR